jgi:hypothetical protein
VVCHASRVLRWSAVAVTGVALASCSSGVTVKRAQGMISGIASNCATLPAKPVTIVVLEDSAVRTSETIQSGARFTFLLSPGHYVVTTGHLYSHVTLGAGASVTVDLVPACARHTT